MSLLVNPGTKFLLEPLFLRGFSGLVHLVLLLVLFASFVSKKLGVKRDGSESSKERSNRRKKALCFRQILYCCLGVSLFNFVLCLLSYFYSYQNGWSEVELLTLLDYALRTLSWGALSVYLQAQFFHSNEMKFPLLLRVWWGFYLSISCYCLVVEIVVYRNHLSSQIQYLLSDSVSVLSGLFLSCLGILNGESEETLLDEPLLDGDSSVGSNLESSKSRGSDTVTPYSNAGLFSVLTFSWMSPLISTGNRKILDLEDVPQLHSHDSAVATVPISRKHLEANGGSAGEVTTFKLVKVLFLSAWKQILFTGMLALLYTLASYVGPYLIDAFVQCLNGRGEFRNRGYLLACTFFCAKIVESLSQRQWYFRLQQIGLRVRAVLVTTIYNKGLMLSCQSKQDQTSGEIINLMSVDGQRIHDFTWHMHECWLVCLQVGLALVILYKNVGIACISAFVATVVVMLLNFPVGRLQEKFQDKLMESKDKRMKATTEILKNMRILKLQGWEMKFFSRINELRRTEEGWLKKYVYNFAVSSFVFWGAPTFVSVVTFVTCTLMKIPLESGKILSALATFRILQEPIDNLPIMISMIVQTKVSLDRIASFLRLAELQSDVVERLPGGTSNNAAIEVVDGNFSWDFSSPNPTLKDLNFKIFHGMRVAVCGTVGSGKSSLLSCILGEVPKISGKLRLCGTIAYVAQSPWIQSGKIEENILFGKEMDRERYERILEACSLKKDLEVLSFGDQTVIGERGINLSGGQKQRIQIARALYQDADIYLFDDPFSVED